MPIEAFGIGAFGAEALDYLKEKTSNSFTVDNRLKNTQEENNKKRLAATIFGETGRFNTEKQARDILSVIIQRANEDEKSPLEVIKESNQFHAYGGNEFQKYFQQLDEPTKKKSQIINKIVDEYFSGKFKLTTNANSFSHRNEKLKLKSVFRGY